MFRKAVCIMMAVFSISSSLNVNIAYADTIKTITDESVADAVAPYIETEAAIIVDVKTGQQLYGKNIYEQHYPASITKIMTCALALENLEIKELDENGKEVDNTITFSKEAVNIEMGSSAAYVVEGEIVSVEDCLYGLMVHSCNDLANGLGEEVSGTIEDFVVLMNSKAKELGCISTNFKNTHGLDEEEHYTCAYDMALIGMYAWKTEPLYREIISTDRYDIPPTNKCEETRYWKNGNELIIDDGYYYYEPCLGGKTGYTEIAMSTLVTYANINGRELICVMLKAPSKLVAMEETKLLYEYIKENVSVDYYAELDKVYEEEKAKEEESRLAEEASKRAEEEKEVLAGAQAEKNDSKSKDKTESGFVSVVKIIFKVFLVILIIIAALFAGMYVYLRYKLYLKRKRRKERMRRREMIRKRNIEERYKQTRFYKSDNTDS